MIGWGSAVSIVLSWIDKLLPSKKAALVEKLNALNAKYEEALRKGDDTNAAIYRKQMVELRKSAGFTNGDMQLFGMRFSHSKTA